MECKFFLNIISEYKLTSSIKKVIFVLADISQNNDITILLENQVYFKNIYCSWDNALFTSMILNQYKPIGLYGLKIYKTKNIFWKLNYGLNLHQDIWRDDKFKLKLEKLMKNY